MHIITLTYLLTQRALNVILIPLTYHTYRTVQIYRFYLLLPFLFCISLFYIVMCCSIICLFTIGVISLVFFSVGIFPLCFVCNQVCCNYNIMILLLFTKLLCLLGLYINSTQLTIRQHHKQDRP